MSQTTVTGTDRSTPKDLAGARPEQPRNERPSALAILIAPNPILKSRARPVVPEDAQTISEIVPRMFEAMYAAPGIGLAAPQVGLPIRLVVVDIQHNDTRDPMVLINPEVTAISKELATREEGCLSLPNMYADVTRPAEVKVRWTDETGARREIEASGLMAACLQHEIDHLDGILFVDHLSVLKRNMIMRKLAKEQRQKAADKAAGKADAAG